MKIVTLAKDAIILVAAAQAAYGLAELGKDLTVAAIDKIKKK